jgi:hypothetical protein
MRICLIQIFFSNKLIFEIKRTNERKKEKIGFFEIKISNFVNKKIGLIFVPLFFSF